MERIDEKIVNITFFQRNPPPFCYIHILKYLGPIPLERANLLTKPSPMDCLSS